MRFIVYSRHTCEPKRSVSTMIMALLIVLFTIIFRTHAMEPMTPEQSSTTLTRAVEQATKAEEAKKLQIEKNEADKEVTQAQEAVDQAKKANDPQQTRAAEFKLRSALLKQEDITKSLLAEATSAETKAAAQKELEQIQKARINLDQQLQNPVWTKTSFTGPKAEQAIEKITSYMQTQEAGAPLVDIILTQEQVPVAQKRASLISRFVDALKSIFGLGKSSIVADVAPSSAEKRAAFTQSFNTLTTSELANLSQALATTANAIAQKNEAEMNRIRQQLVSGANATSQAKYALSTPERLINEIVNDQYANIYNGPNPYAVLNVPENVTTTELIEIFNKKIQPLQKNSAERLKLESAYAKLNIPATRTEIDKNLATLRQDITSKIAPADVQAVSQEVSQFLNEVIKKLDDNLKNLDENLSI